MRNTEYGSGLFVGYHGGPSPGGILQYYSTHAGSSAPANVSTLNDYQGIVIANAAIIASGDNGFVRIGTPGTQTIIFIAGILGMTVTGRCGVSEPKGATLAVSLLRSAISKTFTTRRSEATRS